MLFDKDDEIVTNAHHYDHDCAVEASCTAHTRNRFNTPVLLALHSLQCLRRTQTIGCQLGLNVVLAFQTDVFQLRALAATAQSTDTAVSELVRSTETRPLRVKGPIKKWPPKHLLRGVVATATERNLGQL
eukprot:6458203-Amphidinium_carterae.1